MTLSSLQRLLMVGVMFALPTWCFVPGAPRYRPQRIPRFVADKEPIVDVEFVKMDTTATVTETEEAPSPRSLLEYSLDLDPQWKEARIPFVDSASNRAIDCHLAFIVDLDGSTYGIGIPCDPAAAVTLEQNGKTTYMNPIENEELVEIMAARLQEHLGDDVFLKNTPKILTIGGGGLERYTARWRETLFDETVDREALMDDGDEGLDFFYDFMKKELGEDEFQKTLDECNKDDDGVDKDLLQLFDVPGLGDEENDVEGIQKMLETLLDPDQDSPFESIGQDLEHEGVALKLVGFHFNDDKSYTLVTLLKPFTIVGKYNGDETQDLKFDLLTLQEEKLVIPRLERICQKDLEEAGLSFS